MSIPLPLFVAVPLAGAFLLPLFTKKEAAATFVANVICLALLVMAVLSVGHTDTYTVGKWTIPLGIILVLDGLSGLLLLTVSVVSLAAMVFSIKYMDQYTARPKYLSLFLLMVTGMNGVVLSGDVFNLFVFLEIASIASYALVGFGCGHEELEASFKYMVLGTVASMFILFAIAIVYGVTGSLNMAYISRAITISGSNIALTFAMGMFIAGFGLKAALVPFHAWLPDAHPSAPAPISAMLSGVLIKALGAYALMRVLFNIFGVSERIGQLLLAMGILSMVAGALLAQGQWDFKRLLAYSSISQMGYIVMGFGLAMVLITKGKTQWAALALLGSLYHLINHAVYKSLLFLASGSVEMATGTRDMRAMGGLACTMPLTRMNCTIGSAAIAGIPPFSGFWSKLVLVVAAVGAGFFWLGGVIIAVSVITLIMYLKIQRYVFLGDVPQSLADVREDKGSMQLAMAFLACLCVLMGLLFLVGPIRQSVLDPAVKVLMDGLTYSTQLIIGR